MLETAGFEAIDLGADVPTEGIVVSADTVDFSLSSACH